MAGTLSPQSSGSALVNPNCARLVADNAAAFEQDLSITVAAATASPATQSGSGVTLNNVPASIVAGQPLSGVTFTTSQAQLVLFNVTAGAEEGLRLLSTTLPTNDLGLLIPQTNSLYTVRAYNFEFTTLLFESSQISVSAPPGPLPVLTYGMQDTGRTQTGVTMNWNATAPSYRLLVRSTLGVPYGSFLDTTVSTNSHVFAGMTAGQSRRALVVPQNANGFGPCSSQTISTSDF